MDTAHPAAVRAPHEARRGRRVLVIADLDALHGPAQGKVTLPLRLFWSPAGRVFDLAKSHDLQAMYQVVLNGAICPGELAEFLDAGTLRNAWPDLYLPRPVREAWEERHPQLRPVPAAV